VRGMLILIVLLAGIGAVVMHFGTPAKLSDDTVPARPPPSPEPVSLKTFAGTKDGVMFLATFTFENKGPTDVKDIEVTCTHYGPSGTAIDANTRTIYEIVKAKSSKTVRGFNMGVIHSQAATSSCRIVHYAGG
jgi:hypothetical protein